MTILYPSELETISYRQQGWNAIVSANVQKLNIYLESLWGPTQATYVLGERPVTDDTTTVIDPAAVTQVTLTDNTTGTSTTDVLEISGSGADSDINDNFATLTAELAASKADAEELNTKLVETINYCDNLKSKMNELLAELRVTDGNGVLHD